AAVSTSTGISVTFSRFSLLVGAFCDSHGIPLSAVDELLPRNAPVKAKAPSLICLLTAAISSTEQAVNVRHDTQTSNNFFTQH
ncbi:hypothetical protein RCV41_19725, partial [Escherichia coli]|nr:hypothetical protein [Escherichia coli]